MANCDVPLLVDWNAVWCGPCQMMSGALKVGIKARSQLGMGSRILS